MLFQNWSDLFFIHWEYPADLIQNRLPPGIKVDLYQEKAYMAIVPFTMSGLRLAGLPSLSKISNFLELNLRTYVVDEWGKRGVWFFSLDADSWISVKIANYFFHLPYQYSKLCKQFNDGKYYYSCCAYRDVKHEQMSFELDPAPAGTYRLAEPESIEHFLLERYRLFTVKGNGRILTGTINHQPYLFTSAKALNLSTHLFRLNQFEPPNREPDSVLYAPGFEVALNRIVRNSNRDRI